MPRKSELAKLREEVAALRKELDELKARPPVQYNFAPPPVYGRDVPPPWHYPTTHWLYPPTTVDGGAVMCAN